MAEVTLKGNKVNTIGNLPATGSGTCVMSVRTFNKEASDPENMVVVR